jgi:hypothetical protein
MGEKQIVVWQITKAQFERMRHRMRELAEEYRNLARVQISEPRRQQQAIEGAEMLLGDDWTRVFPAGMAEPMNSPPLRGFNSIPFEPGHWPELNPGPLHGAIGDCHQAYRRYCSAYDRLSDNEKHAHASNGRPRP